MKVTYLVLAVAVASRRSSGHLEGFSEDFRVVKVVVEVYKERNKKDVVTKSRTVISISKQDRQDRHSAKPYFRIGVSSRQSKSRMTVQAAILGSNIGDSTAA